MSTGNFFTELHLNKESSVLVVGENGSGKSTMLDALTFALYGKTFRDIKKPQLLNSINRKGLVVEVEFSIGKNDYLVRRGIKPACFEIYRNDELIDQASKAYDYQHILTKQILKLTYKAFCQVVILGNASFIPFMQLKTADRRSIIEDLLDIQIFSVMNIILKEKAAQNKEKIKETAAQFTTTEQNCILQQQHLAEKKLDVAQRKIEILRKISIAEEEKSEQVAIVDTNLKHLVEMKSRVVDKDTVDNKITQLHSFDVKINSNLTKVNNDILFFENNDNCPVCKQQIEQEFKQNMLASKAEKKFTFEDGLEKLLIEQQKVQATKEKIDEILHEISETSMQITICNQSIEHYNNIIDDLNGQLLSVDKNTVNKQQQKSRSYKEALTILKRQQTKSKNKREIILAASILLKDSGVKAQIIKQYIPIINKLINGYLTSMGFFVQFELDENFKETIKSRFRDEFSYHSFSEGEKMRINLSILFTWRTIAKMRNSASTNLLIMDEVFDSSLDASGTEEFMKLMLALSSDTNTFVISHKGEQLFDKFEKVIKFEKNKGFSRMIIIE